MKPAYVALSGAFVVAFATFSNAYPATLAFLQLIVNVVVFSISPKGRNTFPANFSAWSQALTAGTLLYLSKLSFYWTLSVAGPLASQATFFSIKGIVYLLTREFSNDFESERYFVLETKNVISFTILFAVPIVLSYVYGNPIGGVLSTLSGVVTAVYVLSMDFTMAKQSGTNVSDVRTVVFASAAVLSLVSAVYSSECPSANVRDVFVLIGFVIASAVHAANKKFLDASPAGKIPDWSRGARAALALTWTWSFESLASQIIYAIALLPYAYQIREQTPKEVLPEA